MPAKGYKQSPEAIERIRQKHLGRKATEAQRETLRQAHLGIPLSESHRNSIRLALLGKKHNEKWSRNIALSKIGKKRPDMESENNPKWRGDEVEIGALHQWVKRHLPKPEFCQICNIKSPDDLANKGIYNREFHNWFYLCKKCHVTFDKKRRSKFK